MTGGDELLSYLTAAGRLTALAVLLLASGWRALLPRSRWLALAAALTLALLAELTWLVVHGRGADAAWEPLGTALRGAAGATLLIFASAATAPTTPRRWRLLGLLGPAAWWLTACLPGAPHGASRLLCSGGALAAAAALAWPAARSPAGALVGWRLAATGLLLGAVQAGALLTLALALLVGLLGQRRAVLQAEGAGRTAAPADGAVPPAAPAAAPATAAAVFEPSGMLEMLGGDEQLAAELVGIYLAELPPLLAALRAAAEQHDAAAVQRTAHAIKGSAANLGGQRLSLLAAAAEDLARQGELAAMAAQAPLVQAAGEELHAALQAWQPQAAATASGG
ncbi:MAG: Hpt domain-containing protein [Fimbriimonadaceae bacterium]|nr:Hpt domain-containing protein [Fimbriimonadaceae bacterium]